MDKNIPIHNYKNFSQQQIIQQQNNYFEKLNSILEKHSNVKDIFQNTRYQFNRRDRKTLIIADEVEDTITTTFVFNLQEPLIIDRLCDIYLEHFTTFNCVQNDAVANMYFILKIDQFHNENSSNDSYLQNSLVIPNEATETGKTQTHKSKKLNYICSINPTKLTKISGSITLKDGSSSIIHSENNGDENTALGAFTFEFLFIPRDEE